MEHPPTQPIRIARRTYTRALRVGVWIYVLAVLVVLYLPLVPPIFQSLQTTGRGAGYLSLHAYHHLGDDPVLRSAFVTTLFVALVVAVSASVLGLLAAMSIREFGRPRLILFAMLIPLFVPGISMGFSEGMWFQAIGIPASMGAVVVVQTLWALPFSTLIILTVMASFDPVYLEAAYLCGANRLKALWTIELPLIWPGLVGAAIFSLILSVNETLRTAVVQGPLNTIATYVWSTFKSVGLSPTIYALMSVVIVFTLAMLLLVTAAMIVVQGGRSTRNEKGA